MTGARLIALLAGLVFVAVGAWAFVAPRSFFEALAAFEPYNAHFIRDLGAFQVGLGAVLLLAVRIRDGLTVALGGVGVGAAVHAVGHVLDRDLGGLPWLDVPLLALLAVALLVAAAVRWRARPGQPG